MTQPADFRPDFSHVKPLLLDMARERSTEALLSLVVDRLAEVGNILLARIWLVRPGDRCAVCVRHEDCADSTRCLHRVAEASRIALDDDDSRSLRVPTGTDEVGAVAARGEPVLVMDTDGDPAWRQRNTWALGTGIRGFVAQPLLFQGEVLGVIGVYSRAVIPHEGPSWLRVIADHAAAALANSRAFEEIDRLRAQLERENATLLREIRETRALTETIGSSDEWRRVIRQVDQVAPTDASVLVLGESGTGKEVVAREIHKRSAREDRPIVKVNCASIPRELYESEFFGHRKGSFTGATEDRVGRFELADGGTLFLDEVGEIPLELQAKLLRVLQEGTFERIGDARTRSVDVRVIAATNRELSQAVEEGRFRADLFYRLNVFPIEIPALRERPEDIAPLAVQFVEAACARMHRTVPRIDPSEIGRLEAHPWPGNVRELQNVVERSVILCPNGSLSFDLSRSLPTDEPARSRPIEHDVVHPNAEMEHRVLENIERALAATGGKIHGPGGAAELLGMKPTTLASRVQRLGLGRARRRRPDWSSNPAVSARRVPPRQLTRGLPARSDREVRQES